MAKKKTTKKPATKKKSPPRKSAAKKSSAKKSASKKKTSKKKTSKKVVKKSPARKKSAAKKKSAKKKPASKKAAAKKSPPRKKAAAKKPATKKAASKKPAAKASAAQPDPKNANAKASDTKDSKSGRKGITIVNDKQTRKPRAPKVATVMPQMPSLLGPGMKKRKPLIASGPKAAPIDGVQEDAKTGRKRKSPFTKRKLDSFRAILLEKRAELFGDISRMEEGALQSQGGGLSNLPQHIAEQGSDSADQTLSLNLAAADRVIVKEIDAALQRIADRTYGLCEMTGQPINEERLKELPWARYSIEAAREMERRGG